MHVQTGSVTAQFASCNRGNYLKSLHFLNVLYLYVKTSTRIYSFSSIPVHSFCRRLPKSAWCFHKHGIVTGTESMSLIYKRPLLYLYNSTKQPCKRVYAYEEKNHSIFLLTGSSSFHDRINVFDRKRLHSFSNFQLWQQDTSKHPKILMSRYFLYVPVQYKITYYTSILLVLFMHEYSTRSRHTAADYPFSTAFTARTKGYAYK